MAAIDSTATLGALVAERPERASLFERLHLDYCCGGSQTLAEACAARGLDVDAVGAVLDADGGAGSRGDGLREPGMEKADWRRASLEELCSHIVEVHHGGLRRELPRIDELLARTVRVHAAGHPALRDLQRAFGVIRTRLEGHLEDEEKVLFPGCVALERDGIPIEDELIHANEDEHRDVGERLAALRELGERYDTDRAYCGTHRALLQALAAFELDLHQHVHEENNVLLVRVRELNEHARSTRPAGERHE